MPGTRSNPLGFLFGVTLYLLVIQAAALAEPAPAEPRIKVGATLALTGKLASVGTKEYEGLAFGFENLKKEKGIDIDFIVEDNTGDPKLGTSSASKLIDIDKVDVLMSAFTHISQAVKGVAARSGLPFVYISTSKTIAAENPLFFRDFYDVEDAGRVMAKTTLSRGFTSVAYIREDGEACQLNEQAFTAAAATLGITINYKGEFPSGSDDIKVLLLKAKKQEPHAIVLCAWRDTAMVMTDMHELGLLEIPTIQLEAPVFSQTDTPEMRALFEKNRTISTWYGYIEGSQTPAQQRFNAEFQAKFGHKPTPDALLAYDLARAIGTTAQQCRTKGRVNSACFAKALAAESFEGPSGTLSFDKDRSSSRPTLLMEVKRGVWVATE